MKSRFVSLRAKQALLIILLSLTATGTAIFAVIEFGEGALVGISDTQSRLMEGALMEEWERAVVADSKVVARSLADPIAALDASAMAKIASLTLNSPGVTYVYVLTPKGQVLADGTGSRKSVGKILDDDLTRTAVSLNAGSVQRYGGLLDVAIPIWLGRQRIGTVRIGYAPERILGTIANMKHQVRTAIDDAGDGTLIGLVGMMTAAGAVILIVGLLFARSMTAPLAALVQATRSFGAGHLSTRVNLPPRNDELGELATAFDEMMDHIKDHAAGLERLVQERTQDLRESELLLRSIVDAADVVINLKDRDGRFLMVNREFERRLGLSSAQVIGKSVHELFPDHDTRVLDELERRVIETGESAQGEVSALRDPKRRINLTTKFPVRNSLGETVAIGGINADITDLKRTQEELHESEMRLRSIIDNAQAEITLKDPDGRYLMVNRAFERNHGVNQAEVIGRTLGEICSPELAAPSDNLHRKVLETGEAVQQELIPVGNSNAELFLSTKFPIKNDSGEIAAVGTIDTDITEIKRAQDQLRQARDELEVSVDQRTRELGETEERYRQLVNVSPDGIMVHSDGVIVFANPTFIELIGATSEDQVIGRKAIDFVPEDDRATVLERRRKAAESAVLDHRETWYRRLDGTLVPVERAIAKVMWHGKPALLILARNIAERKRREEQLWQSQKMEVVGHLTGSIAHDFNNLLTVILGYFELKEKSATKADTIERMRELASSAARKGADLTQRLLTFARRQSLEPRPLDLSELVGSMTNQIGRTLGEAITIHIECDAVIWPCVADATHLEHSLLNLCLNARDAMPGGGELTITMRTVELDETAARRIGELSAGRYVVLSVTDNGHGMPREIADKVLEPFFTTKAAESGIGLGLSMVYGFIRQSGGDVRIITAPGAGTTVELYLPASQEETEDIPATDDSSAAVSGSGERVLIVEDDPAVRTLGATMLTALGYEVVEAENGSSALDILAKDATIMLLFSDVAMPGGMRGSELARRARELRRDLKVILTSGYFQDDRQTIDPGGDELLPKPYTKDQLSTVIRRALDDSQAR